MADVAAYLAANGVTPHIADDAIVWACRAGNEYITHVALGISPERIAAYEAHTFAAGEVYILQEFAVTAALYDLPHLPRGDDQGMSGDPPAGTGEAEEGELPDWPALMYSRRDTTPLALVTTPEGITPQSADLGEGVRGHAFSGTCYHPQACDTLVSHACLPICECELEATNPYTDVDQWALTLTKGWLMILTEVWDEGIGFSSCTAPLYEPSPQILG
ncbi:hypothetical protein EV401DRAFT_1888999 [Pisolithus croceorrhizus]|nr:hypothetical protein EV401DRAFT_1888999 [Pisolithus croceorrhizus]